MSAEGSATAAARGVTTSQSYWRELRYPLIVALVVCTTGFAFAGYVVRPSAQGPPALQPAPSIVFHVNATEIPVLILTESLQVLRNHARELDAFVYATDSEGNGRNGLELPWTVTVSHLLGGSPCPNPGSGLTDVTRQPSLTRGADDTWTGGTTSQLSDIEAFASVKLCWSDDGPVAESGSFLSATVPQVEVTGTDLQSLLIERSFCLRVGQLEDYSLQSGRAPDALVPDQTCGSGRTEGGPTAGEKGVPLTWTWIDQISKTQIDQANLIGTDYTYALPVEAASFFDIQRDNHNAFYAGIFLGIAGGALIGLVTEFVGPLRRRRRSHKRLARSIDEGTFNTGLND